jgi:hypothetical protein
LNQLQPRWGIIPNTNPRWLGNHPGSPLVQLRNRGPNQRYTLRDTMPLGRSGLLNTCPWTLAMAPLRGALSLTGFWPVSGLSGATRLRDRFIGSG